MELYKIIATCKNNSESFIFDYMPENFEGVKISQNFTFQIPIGYNPKFSVDTMRIIRGNAFTVDTWFLTYGLETVVEIEIQKLNATGTAYEFLSTFAIDFETYEIQEHFSEFALKAISVMDDYNKIKNREMQFALTEDCVLPNTQNFVDYISVKSTGVFEVSGQTHVLQFKENNESKIFSNDTALLNDIIIGASTIKMADFLDSKNEGGLSDSFFNVSVSGKINFSSNANDTYNVTICMYDEFLHTFTRIHTISSGVVEIGDNRINIDKSIIDLSAYFYQDVYYFILIESDFATLSFSDYPQDFFLDVKRNSYTSIIGSDSERVNYVESGFILNSIFNGNITVASSLQALGVTSGQHILKLNDFAVLKPKDFLSDFCIATGAILNFKKTGLADIKTITTYFNDLLKTSNAVEITDYKDFSITYNKDLNYSSVSVGCEPKEYDVYSYLIDWNKVLTFQQVDRNATENLDLTLQKLRVDFSGMLDLFYKRSQQSDLKVNENYLFRPNFALVDYPEQITPELNLYDHYNPRAILDSWGKFLSFFFQNFGKNTLTISSNGGTVDNLDIHSISQMDNLTLNQTPRLLPIEVNFKALIPSGIDFSEKILKVTHDSEIFYIFVINSETTDKLSEHQIKGLKIQMT